MKYAILNKKIKNFKVENQSVLKKDIISFYWSKKNPIVLSSILDHFVETNQTIFDPFLGSGTTAIVAMKHNRRFIGIEKNKEYFELACENLKKIELEKDNHGF